MNVESKSSVQDKEKIFELWRLFDHTRFIVARLRGLELVQEGITAIQVYVLDTLVTLGGQATIHDIMEVTGRRHHTLSTLINRMAQRGLVTKIKDDCDARKMNVVITGKGSQLFSRISRNYIYRIFGNLSPEERRDMEIMLKKTLHIAYDIQDKKVPSLFA